MIINENYLSEPEAQAYINSLLARIAELEERHWNECRQIAHYSDELRRAKELLKAAVEDMSEKNFCVKACKRDNFVCRVSDTCDFKWRYADEALKLIES